MVIDFVTYLEEQKAREAAVEAERAAEAARQARLEWVLVDLLDDIEAA